MGLLENGGRCPHEYLKSKCGRGHILESGAYSAFVFGVHFYYGNLLLSPSTLCLIALTVAKKRKKLLHEHFP